jgi:hypothetical protein
MEERGSNSTAAHWYVDHLITFVPFIEPFRFLLQSQIFSKDASRAGHCLNMLRLVLTCNPDTGVHPFVWAKHSNNASYPAHVFPDFQRPHKCKNFNDILQYAKSSKSMTSGTVDILPKKDSLILPDWP